MRQYDYGGGYYIGCNPYDPMGNYLPPGDSGGGGGSSNGGNGGGTTTPPPIDIRVSDSRNRLVTTLLNRPNCVAAINAPDAYTAINRSLIRSTKTVNLYGSQVNQPFQATHQHYLMR